MRRSPETYDVHRAELDECDDLHSLRARRLLQSTERLPVPRLVISGNRGADGGAAALDAAGIAPSIAALRERGVSHERRAASLESPLAAFEQMLRDRASTRSVEISYKALPGVPRLELKRAIGGGAMRYLEVHAVDDATSPWRLAFLFGEYGSSHSTDGRSGGDLAYVRSFIEAWLVDLRPASDLPAPTA